MLWAEWLLYSGQYQKDLKQQGGRFKTGAEFVKPAIIGVLIVAGLILADFLGDSEIISEFCSEGIASMIGGILFFYLLFSIPFGMIWLSDRFAPRYETRHTHFLKMALKITISLLVGWVIFAFYLVRFIGMKIRS